MLHWDSLELANGSTVPGTVYVKSHGTEATGSGQDGVSLVTQVRATLEPDAAVAVGDVVKWKAIPYTVTAVIPVSAKGVIRFQTASLARVLG